MSAVGENMSLMQILDDAGNSRNRATFDWRHVKEAGVFRQGQEKPAYSRPSRRGEAISFFEIFPGNRVGNRPCRILFGQGDRTCSVAGLTGTFRGSLTGADGKVIPPAGKKSRIEFCTVAHGKNGESMEAKLFCDKISLMQQIGIV